MLAAARPNDSASSAVRNSPATPRTPSVPNRRAGALTTPWSALRELRALACLLEARLLALLGARVRRQIERGARRRRLAGPLGLRRLGPGRLGLCDGRLALLAGRRVAVGVLVDVALGALLGQDQVGLEVCSRHHLVLLLLLAVTIAPLTALTLRLLGLPGRALVRGVGFGGRLGRRLGVLDLGGLHVPGRA